MSLNPNPSDLDQQQILQRSFDGTSDRLRVDAELSASIIAPPGLEVSIQAADDNIAIRNSTNSNELLINSNGSINVNVLAPLPTAETIINSYNEILSVASNVLTTINTYTMPVGKSGGLLKVAVSGDNIATYTVLVNSVVIDKKRTMFGDNLNETFDFLTSANTDSELGYELSAGDVVTVKVIQPRPSMADFNARIQVLEIG